MKPFKLMTFGSKHIDKLFNCHPLLQQYYVNDFISQLEVLKGKEFQYLLTEAAGASQLALMVKNLPANAGDARDLCSIPE